MSRRHKHIVSSPPSVLPKFWFPLTSDASDAMGNFPGWGTVSGVTFSSSGGYFNGNGKIAATNLNIQNSDLKTWGVEIMLQSLYSSGIYTAIKNVYTTSNTEIQISYAPGWSQDINCAPFYMGGYKALSISSVPFVANRYYKLMVRQKHSDCTSELFVDGVRKKIVDIVIPANQILAKISIGFNEANSGRGFKGYIRNVRFFDVELTDEQIAQI